MNNPTLPFIARLLKRLYEKLLLMPDIEKKFFPLEIIDAENPWLTMKRFDKIPELVYSVGSWEYLTNELLTGNSEMNWPFAKAKRKNKTNELNLLNMSIWN